MKRSACPILIITLVFCLSACDMGGGRANLTPTPHRVSAATPTAASILLGPQPCPAQVQNPTYWNPLVQLSATQNVEGVVCGYLTGQPLMQAVVMVRSNDQDRLLDIHVFTRITSTPPSQIFSLTGLQSGEARLSNYNTLLTNQGVREAYQTSQIVHTLAREFKWSDNTHTLVQVGFVGLYPDLTRLQAEATQQQVNAGQGDRAWQLDAVSTAQTFAETVLRWPNAAPATVVSGAGTHDARAVIQVSNPAAGNASIQVSLSRLELNTNGGIWEVTDVATTGMALTAPQSLQQLASPTQVSGSAALTAGERVVLSVFNDERTGIGQKTLLLKTLGTPANFSTSVPYTSPFFQGNVQEGIIALYTLTSSQQISGCVMLKVLLEA